MINLKGFKVIHGDKVLNALEILGFDMPEDFYDGEKRKQFTKPRFLEVVAINEDGNIVIINDEAWTFQFVPIINK